MPRSTGAICVRGKVYELAMPSVFVHVVGQAPLKATVYERIRLRCNLCGEIFTPELPEDIKDKKFDDSASNLYPVGYSKRRGYGPLAGS
ncbi:MAG TPA: hypothetical protein VJZ49_10810 [Syntrophales bacterium]|nr:hypothetical protein [Syntrophales bacterium]